MSTPEKNVIYLKDYTPPAYLVDTVHLRVELFETATRVRSRLSCRPNEQAEPGQPLEFNGEHLELVSVGINGNLLNEQQFNFNDGKLRIEKVPEELFELEIKTITNPGENTALEGLYLSSGNYCTQCEAEGFRRITCFPDRPDVMAIFTTTIIGDRENCSVLLSNGNLVEKGELDDGRHYATWHDPFKKPCYLFALVAGNLIRIEDSFRTMSGREVALHIYVEERNRKKCGHAMASLQKAMRWDEEVFGREYDLDSYMIVAVDDFNMGAMENKGLNVFNSKYVLALPETATDVDYEGIEGVIAHEYFHNWTGNRVTCRDWFQLSLKEGLTVFRDQEFTSDMTSRPVKRIHDVNVIRSFQFREDAGPMSHPVRPDSFVEINNFYTLTVYNKGAEVIRMIYTLLGAERFRKGLDLYFERHDGQAVTCDDFVRAMEDAGGFDLSRFKRWYSQAGTPELVVAQEYDPLEKELHLNIKQSCPATPDQQKKEPFYMPLAIGLLDGAWQDLPVELKTGEGREGGNNIILLDSAEQNFCCINVPEKPVLSFLRGFSAPVKVKPFHSDEELAFLMAHDSDPFNRWDAGQQLAMKFLLEQIRNFQQGKEVKVPRLFTQAFDRILTDETGDPAFLALAMTLPTANWIGQQMECIDPDAIFAVRQAFRYQLSWELRDDFWEMYHTAGTEDSYRYTAAEAGRRSFRNCCLGYLLVPEGEEKVSEELLAMGEQQYHEADNMSDVSAALGAVVNADRAAGDLLLDDFYGKWRQDPLVMDKWLTLQGTCSLPGTLDKVKELTRHPVFNIKNPNKVRALISAFCAANHQFHIADGSGYVFLTDYVLQLDTMNPQIASRLLTPLTQWKQYDAGRRQLMREQLERIKEQKKLSSDVAEVVNKSLDQ